MKNHCESLKSNVFDIMPLTFSITIDVDKPNAINSELSSFVNTFSLLEYQKQNFSQADYDKLLNDDEGTIQSINDHLDKFSCYSKSKIMVNESLESRYVTKQNMNMKDTTSLTRVQSFNFQKPKNSDFTQLTMPLSHFDSHNFWILKATNLNRGRGIHVFSTLSQLFELIK